MLHGSKAHHQPTLDLPCRGSFEGDVRFRDRKEGVGERRVAEAVTTIIVAAYIGGGTVGLHISARHLGAADLGAPHLGAADLGAATGGEVRHAACAVRAAAAGRAAHRAIL